MVATNATAAMTRQSDLRLGRCILISDEPRRDRRVVMTNISEN
jgi:hypothetical protein